MAAPASAPSVVCIGAVLWDYVGHSAAPVGRGADLPGRIVRMPGGVALNVALALARLGLRPALLSAVGTDPEGAALLAEAAAAGLRDGLRLALERPAHRALPGDRRRRRARRRDRRRAVARSGGRADSRAARRRPAGRAGGAVGRPGRDRRQPRPCPPGRDRRRAGPRARRSAHRPGEPGQGRPTDHPRPASAGDSLCQPPGGRADVPDALCRCRGGGAGPCRPRRGARAGDRRRPRRCRRGAGRGC